jgi:aryl-alcohol dehydrogenase-like predicted oxidoreductase
MLCHESEIEDPSIYLEAFEILKQRGRVLRYGISTDRLDILKRFNVNGTCDVLEADYSLLNREPEAELFPYCQEHGIAVLIRGPLAMGLLSGKYTAETRFTDSVRSAWHEDAAMQEEFEKKAAQVDRLRSVVAAGQEMVTASLRFAFSHPVCPVVIPGATNPDQAVTNAAAGERELTSEEREKLLAALG